MNNHIVVSFPLNVLLFLSPLFYPSRNIHIAYGQLFCIVVSWMLWLSSCNRDLFISFWPVMDHRPPHLRFSIMWSLKRSPIYRNSTVISLFLSDSTQLIRVSDSSKVPHSHEWFLLSELIRVNLCKMLIVIFLCITAIGLWLYLLPPQVCF